MGIDTSGACLKGEYMLYCIKYRKMKPLVDEKNGIMRSDIKGLCVVCGLATSFIDINFEAHVCSDGCRKELIRNYFEYKRFI